MLSAAKYGPGWGDLSTRALFGVERPSPHPVTHSLRYMRNDPPPPGEGESSYGLFGSNRFSKPFQQSA
jgi:hypothetical protein